MTYEALQRFRRTLVAQRAALIASWRQALSDEYELLTGPEPDWSDEAAATSAATVIDGVGSHALERIQSSLARIDRGTYDECVACHDRIEEERLRAVPDTDRCGACAPRLN